MADHWLQGTLGGIDIEFTDTLGESYSKSIVEHEFPNADGVRTEDMGKGPRTFAITCLFANERFPEYRDIVQLLKERSVVEFDHPIYGVTDCKIKSVDVRLEELELFAFVSVNLVVNDLDAETDIIIQADIQQTVAGLVLDAESKQVDEYIADTQDAIGPEGLDVTALVIDKASGFTAQMGDIASKTRSFVSRVETTVRALDATLSSVTQPADSVIAGIEWASDLPGISLQSLAQACERYGELYRVHADSPYRFMTRYQAGIEAMRTALALTDEAAGGDRSQARAAAATMMSKHLTITAAQVGALYLAEFFSDDEEDRREVDRIEVANPFDLENNYTDPGIKPDIMTIKQIEGGLATSRELLQSAVDVITDIPQIKQIADSMLDYVKQLKLRYDEIKSIYVHHGNHLFNIMHAEGLRISMADRVLAINPVVNPNDIQGDLDIYV